MEDNKNNKSEYSGKLQLKKTFNAGQIKQSFSHGRSRSVSVEVKRKRTLTSFKGEENNLNETVPSSDEPEKSLAGPSTQKRETTK
jgi:translation initiation factor IF-2